MNHLLRTLLCVASVLATASVLPAQTLQGSASAAPVLRAGDAVRITVWRRPELSGEFTLAEDGAILHPLYRTIRISGIPLPEAEQRVGTFLTQFDASPAFVIEPLVRVVVSGQVRQPNVYNLRVGTTIAQAVVVAGGPGDRGDFRSVQLVRDGRVTQVDLTKPDEVTAQLAVRSGDHIMVPRSRALFREVVTPTLTVVGAVAAVVNVILRAQE